MNRLALAALIFATAGAPRLARKNRLVPWRAAAGGKRTSLDRILGGRLSSKVQYAIAAFLRDGEKWGRR